MEDDLEDLKTDKRLLACRNLAYKVHAGQFRKFDPVPYIKHPIDVYEMVEKNLLGKISNRQWLIMACVAYDHDTVEDCSTSFPNINELIQEAQDDLPVLPLVLELTNVSIPFKGKLNRAARKKMDRDHLKKASWEAKIIKMFDRICNLRDLRGSEEDFKRLYAQESRALLEVIKDADEGIAAILLQEIEKIENEIPLEY